MSFPSWAWIAITLFAVAMQSVRTAGQKALTAHLDAVTVTLVRFLFGLPFVVAYLVAVMQTYDLTLPPVNDTFVVYTVTGGIAQIVATWLLLYLFTLRNFAVGTTYARTEAFLTALVGAVFFAEIVTVAGWIAIVISVGGVVVLTIARSGAGRRGIATVFNRAALVGLGSGLGFALSSLSIRKASLSFGIDNSLFTAGLVLVSMVILQSLAMTVYVALRSPGQIAAMCRHWPAALFVGVTSALGSMGWFVAMTLERAAYVKALGQAEFLLALGISTLYFREQTSRLEGAGMILVAAGILVLVFAG